MSARISVVINTRNAARWLEFSLRSVRDLADEIVVVDMASTDGTQDIARAAGALVHDHEPLRFADPARAFAVGLATGDWILVLDGDELVPPALASRLRSVAERPAADVYWLPRHNRLLGAPLRGTGLGPDQDDQLRFFRRGAVEFGSTIHRFAHPVPGRTVARLDGPGLVHFNYADVSDFLARLDRYTTIEAEQRLAAGRRSSAVRALGIAGWEFFTRYVRKRGFRDGWRGLYLAGLRGAYRFTIHAKMAQLERAGSRADIEAAYELEARTMFPDMGPPGEQSRDGAEPQTAREV